MNPLIGAALIGAGGGLLEGMLSGRGQRDANRESMDFARENMRWQETMSNTAYQRSVQDMQKAGLNPLYWLRGGASTPGGSMPTIENTMEGFRGTTAKALEARLQSAQIGNIEAQNKQILSQVALNTATAKKVMAEEELLRTAKGKERFISDIYGQAHSAIDQLKKGIPDFGKSVGGALYDITHPKVNVYKKGQPKPTGNYGVHVVGKK